MIGRTRTKNDLGVCTHQTGHFVVPSALTPGEYEMLCSDCGEVIDVFACED